MHAAAAETEVATVLVACNCAGASDDSPMVNFGEFLQAEVERPEARHTRVFFVDYHALKERLYEIDQGLASMPFAEAYGASS